MHVPLNHLWPILIFGIALVGCESAPQGGEAADQYFSLEQYFDREIKALNSRQPAVSKTVRKNSEREQRNLSTLDWETELKTFRNADINKPAWRDSYSIDSAGGALTYKALEEDLRVRSLQVHFTPDGQVSAITIERKASNYLYASSERLEYYPDSLYSIERHQEVRLLGTDEFQVSGRF